MFNTVAGSVVSVAVGVPATNNAAGFAALTWVVVGEITDIPSVVGRDYSTVTHSPIASAQEIEKKGSYKLPTAEFKCAWDKDDAGQIIIEAASKSYAIYSIKVHNQNSTDDFLTAQVKSFMKQNGTSNNVQTGSFVLLRQTDTITV